LRRFIRRINFIDHVASSPLINNRRVLPADCFDRIGQGPGHRNDISRLLVCPNYFLTNSGSTENKHE
jgi:hypothetical protein